MSDPINVADLERMRDLWNNKSTPEPYYMVLLDCVYRLMGGKWVNMDTGKELEFKNE